jgi:hypothetical protein
MGMKYGWGHDGKMNGDWVCGMVVVTWVSMNMNGVMGILGAKWHMGM